MNLFFISNTTYLGDGFKLFINFLMYVIFIQSNHMDYTHLHFHQISQSELQL